MKIQLKGTIGSVETKQSLCGLAIYNPEDQTISFRQNHTQYFLNLEKMTLRKENEDSILRLHWDLTKRTTGHYELKSMGRIFELSLKTRKIEVSSSRFLVEYQLEEEIILFELTWEEVA